MMRVFGIRFHLFDFLGIFAGIFLGLFMFIRYFFIVRDIDRLIIYTLVGFLFAMIFYLHNYTRNADEDKKFVHDRLDALYSDSDKTFKKVRDEIKFLEQKIDNFRLEMKTYQKPTGSG